MNQALKMCQSSSYASKIFLSRPKGSFLNLINEVVLNLRARERWTYLVGVVGERLLVSEELDKVDKVPFE
eukprot:snap_masked-scaffold_19-processed-gene-3.11-mRNA-1 protein AED:1.00 eAED:1.00 QI:0/-1/0/0/-1/1/1/0/69